MRKTILTALMAFALAMGSFGMAFADSASASWNVTFNSDKKMVSDYDQSKIDADLQQMQPGDDLTLDVSIKNDSAESTEWYMTSTVIRSLEDANEASGGAYTYVLSYNGNELYNSARVGGDGTQGLHEIDDATGSWLHVASLAPGQSGTVQLYMALDGMTQENVYQNREGGLQINFAVEDAAEPTRVVTGGQLPQTGDMLMDLLIYAVCALLVALTALSWYRDRTKVKAACASAPAPAAAPAPAPAHAPAHAPKAAESTDSASRKDGDK